MLTHTARCLTALAIATLTLACARNEAPQTDPTGPMTYEALLEEALARPSVISLQGTTKMRLTYPGRSVRLRGILVAQGPVSLRAEVLSLLGQPVAYLVEGPENLSLFSPYSGTYLTTDDPQGILTELAGKTVSQADLVGLLLGQTPSCVSALKGQVEITEEGRVEVPCLEGDEAVRTLHFDPESWALVGVVGEARKGGTFEVELGNHQLMEGALVPHHITFTAPALELIAELDYEEIVVNTPVDPGLFVLTVPEGPEMKSFEELLLTGPEGLGGTEPEAPSP